MEDDIAYSSYFSFKSYVTFPPKVNNFDLMNELSEHGMLINFRYTNQ